MNDSWLKRSVMLRMAIIGFLTMAMLIPSILVMELVSGRERTRSNAIAEVSEKWGERQTIAGPVLTLPFKRLLRNDDGTSRTVIEHAQLLPATLTITAGISPEIRHRGIYQVTLYTATADIQGRFSLDGLRELNITPDDIMWGEASLTFGVSDLKGMRDVPRVRWNNNEALAGPGTGTGNAIASGINIKPAMTPPQQNYDFAVTLSVNGSEQMDFVPLGQETHVSVSSGWSSPSFAGRFLPDERTLRSDGFDAKWHVLHLNRNIPQQWVSERLASTGNKMEFEQFSFGVKLISPVDQYQQTMRSAKYAIMFIALTFLAFFLTEILSRKVGHPVHYALVGLALVLFYLLLLSLSEHMSFSFAYLVSSAATVSLIGAYSRSVLGTNRFAAIISSLLVLLYTFLYVILQQEDYALLVGSIGLFVVLALVMYLTRRIDWYSVGGQ